MESIALSPTELRATLGTLGLPRKRLARILGVGARSLRRWRSGDRCVPHGVGIVLCLLAAGAITIDQVERVAAPADGDADLGGSADPAPDGDTALVEPDSTAAKVFALRPHMCRWPLGDPGRPDFRFCREPVVAGKAYCEVHC